MRTPLAIGVLAVSSFAFPAFADEAPPPGTCPGGDAVALREALGRLDAGGGPAADLDVAACYRALGQDFPEAVALLRALDGGLPEADEALVNARLDVIGRPQATERFSAPPETLAGANAAATEPPGDEPSPVWAYTLAGLSAAALAAATATAFVALDQDSSGEDATTMGIVGGVCGAVGIAAGIAAAILWPDEEVAPTAGPGDVGVGVAIRF